MELVIGYIVGAMIAYVVHRVLNELNILTFDPPSSMLIAVFMWPFTAPIFLMIGVSFLIGNLLDRTIVNKLVRLLKPFKRK